MRRTIRELILSALFAAGLFLAIDSMTSRNYIDGPSMEPNLHQDQVLLVSRIGISGLTRQVYAATHPDNSSSNAGWIPPRGSIITFIHPSDPTRQLIKRVIALPGEEIAIDHGVTYINGQPLDEPYVAFHDNHSMSPRAVPPNTIFVLGDNRPESADSRLFGPVPRANLLGIAVLRYWPPSKFGLLFALP